MIFAPAKINLTLGVLGRRPDGFHEVDTTLLALDFGDRVSVATHGRSRVRLSGPAATDDVPTDGRNLAARAAAAVAGLAGLLAPNLLLEKVVPSRAGLGGGSSDAAAAAYLTALELSLDLDDPRIARALAELGSDCPFFLVARKTGIARCTGRGEVVAPLAAVPPWWFVVTTPSLEVSTPAVWQALEPGDWSGARDAVTDDLAAARAGWSNDLERAACVVEPGLLAWRALLDELGEGHQRLAGSGSSFFGAYESKAAATRAAERIASAGKARDLGLRAQFVARARGAGVGR
ncbi:MAG: 4-(cytidine 5'-diphospho)-2-C-methyl-D-erythritol kinase [Planctomycetota bacterium]